MPGTLTISTLSDGTNSTSATNPILGSARAWVNFNGTVNPSVIRTSYNVSSVTFLGTGSYTINYTNALSSNPAIFTFVSDDASTNRGSNLQGTNDGFNLTTSARISVWQVAGGVSSTGVYFMAMSS